MKHYLKQFMEWVIDLKRNLQNNIFEKARIRLTIFYVGMIVIVMAIFSFALLVTFKQNISDSLGDQLDNSDMIDRVFNQTIDNVEKSILIIDGIILILVAGVGYVLAGRTLRPIRKALESQKQFTADASHDLRTPLAILKTESEVLLQSNSNNIDEYKKNIKSNLEEIDRMSRLVADLLLVARTEGGDKMHSEKLVQINLKNFIEKLVNKNINQAAGKSINLKNEDIPEINVYVFPDSLERALQNVIQNSIKYTEPKGSIVVRVNDVKNLINIIIDDTGIGIDKECLPHVFDRFYKASHSRNDLSGSGLGLSIVKYIVEQHKGKISIESDIGVGTKVTIIIPKKFS
jgi:signal transduction histidine kinase